MGKITVNRETASQAPGALVFFTSPNVDSAANSGEGDITERMRIASNGNIVFPTDGNTFSFGADSEVTLTHVHDTGLLLNAAMEIQFRDSAISIGSTADGDLAIAADDEIDITSTLVDINANLDVSGTYVGGGLMTTGGNIVIPDAGTIGSASVTDAMVIDSAGRIQVNGTAVVDVARLSVSFDGANSTGVSLKALAVNGGTISAYQNSSNTTVGSITTNGSTVAFNTSSDYRLKENINYSWDATTRLKQLKPARFNFINDADTTVDGFLAHEAQEVVPEAVTGTKDEIDDDTNPIIQGIDQAKLVPLLVKTIQELEARITALEA
jgi:hypothetical protein